MTMLSERPANTRPRVQTTSTPDASLAKQSSRDECDINQIMAKFAKTGVVTHFNEHKGDYGDFCDAGDYLESQIIVQQAKEMFHTIPAGIRQHFDNNPAKFLEFAQDPNNQEEMIEMGLAKRVHTSTGPQPDPSVDPQDPPQADPPEGAADTHPT